MVDLFTPLTEEEARYVLQTDLESYRRYVEGGLIRRSVRIRDFPPCNMEFPTLADLLEFAFLKNIEVRGKAGGIFRAEAENVLNDMAQAIDGVSILSLLLGELDSCSRRSLDFNHAELGKNPNDLLRLAFIYLLSRANESLQEILGGK